MSSHLCIALAFGYGAVPLSHPRLFLRRMLKPFSPELAGTTRRCLVACAPASDAPVANISANHPLQRGDFVNVRVKSLDYGGGGVAEIADPLSVHSYDASMRIHTPKGVAPGDLVKVKLTKVRRRSPHRPLPQKNQSHRMGPDPSAMPDTAKVKRPPYLPVPIADALFVDRLERSLTAVVPPCVHFGNSHLGGGSCGGCVTMDIAYENQIAEKQRQVERLFGTLTAESCQQLSPFLTCAKTFAYRNKMEFSFGRKWHLKDPKEKKKPSNQTVSDKVERGLVGVDRDGTPAEDVAVMTREYALGLHVPGRYDRIVEISECHIQQPVANAILEYVRRWCDEFRLEPYDAVDGKGYLRNVCIRSAMNAEDQLEIMVNLHTNPCDVPGRLVPLAEELRATFPNIVCVLQNMPSSLRNVAMDASLQRLLSGERAHIVQNLCGLTFEISANSFFQTNPFQAEVLYDATRKMAALRPHDVVLDLFCGTGTIGLSMAEHCRKIIGVEISEDAIEDAKRNAARNGIKSAHFVVGDLLRIRQTPLPMLEKESPDVIVVDPPRAGLHKDVVKYLSNTTARRIVYVSCNPATQVQDLEYLQGLRPGRFVIDCIQPVDMFPHTPHIECIVGISVRVDD